MLVKPSWRFAGIMAGLRIRDTVYDGANKDGIVTSCLPETQI